jgi:hypothetical protein
VAVRIYAAQQIVFGVEAPLLSRSDYHGRARADHHHAPGNYSPVEAGYIFADLFLTQSGSAYMEAADHPHDDWFTTETAFPNGQREISELNLRLRRGCKS